MTSKCRTRIDANKVWEREAHDFTPYLCTHIDELSKCVGLNLKFISRETSAKIPGSNARYIDILAKDIESGNKVIIENQYKVSDDSHYRRCRTYAAIKQAKTIIWICETFTDEFKTTLNYDNETSKIKCYAVELHVLDDGSHYYIVVVSPKAHNSNSDVNSTNVRRTHKQRKSSKKYISIMEDLVKHSKTKSCAFEFGNISDKRNWLPIKATELKEKFGCRLDIGLIILNNKKVRLKLRLKNANKQSTIGKANMKNTISILPKYKNESRLAISNEIKWKTDKCFTIEYEFDAVDTKSIMQITDQFYNFFKEIQF